MSNKTAAALALRDDDRPKLEELIRLSTVAAGLAQRARIVLLAADGVANYEIAARVWVSRPTVNLWRNRYAERGMAGLATGQRPAANGGSGEGDRRYADAAPKSLGVTHWSSRLLAGRLGCAPV